MIKIHKIPVGPLQTNCYVVVGEKSKKAIIIDPGDEAGKIIDVVRENGLKPEGIALTHSHFDHIGALEEVKKLTTCDVVNLKDGDEVEIGETKLKIIETPGHTKDSICIVDEESKSIFTGDTLFKNSIGRTDLPGSDGGEMAKSLKKLMKFPDDFKIYPGHGEESTIGEERQYNHFLQ